MTTTMMIDLHRHLLPLLAPADEGAPGAGAEVLTTEGGGNGDGAGAGAGAGAPPEGTPGDEKPWFEAREWSDPTLKEHLVNAGYHKGTPEEALERALKGEQSASKKLGRAPETLIDAPGKDQPINDWLKANAARLGVPDKAEDYTLTKPEGLPEGLPLDDKMLDAFKADALARGLPPALAQQTVDFYAQTMGAEFQARADEAKAAEEAMDTALKESWGAAWKDNQQLAVRGFQTLAAEMKMDADTAKNLASKLNSELGDAGLLKFFHGLATKLGDDTLAIPQGGSAPAMAVEQATARKEAIMAKHTGDMAKAQGNQTQINKLKDELRSLNAVIGGKA